MISDSDPNGKLQSNTRARMKCYLISYHPLTIRLQLEVVQSFFKNFIGRFYRPLRFHPFSFFQIVLLFVLSFLKISFFAFWFFIPIQVSLKEFIPRFLSDLFCYFYYYFSCYFYSLYLQLLFYYFLILLLLHLQSFRYLINLIPLILFLLLLRLIE